MSGFGGLLLPFAGAGGGEGMIGSQQLPLCRQHKPLLGLLLYQWDRPSGRTWKGFPNFILIS